MKFAVVIPALNEADHIEAAIKSALGVSRDCENSESGTNASGSGPRSAADLAGGGAEIGIEVVVVDGGSTDETRERAAAVGARVLKTPGAPGRGRQLDEGFRQTDGDVVLFLHADSRLPAGWARAIERRMADTDVAGGAFRFAIEEPGLRARCLELGVALRVGLLRLPYGDQALFVRRGLLEAAGGVPHVTLMEDLDLVSEIKSAGRLVMLPLPVTTSARRYERSGFVRTVALHAVALAGWSLGVDRDLLARWIRR